ncbi:similar to alpha/beta hydrolase [Plenodomus lingam JN3]|uniref:Similar to alpha/beta hydrolase n=1 Tax=Leptosphaeria maculans (strain JN3 / isolate v23.1.3 / race Av1-4-5-6-7-8) TaxID=985895 RepID=E5AA86_LEPMJ|nr:similar to alpha/beta hydrolase [Plenodomus lingam JN3]CBY00577.1 similar to alpha/beta hydrolase [Plenodomus lingam JN3]
MAPLTVEELLAHPEFEHLVWDLEPEKKGKLAVAKDRGGPINIAYEVHGHGDRHLVWIMGLGGMKDAWQRQTKDFAHDQADKYSSLILDNRGIGESDKPIFRYSTSEMAKDVIEVIDHIGWIGKRELHVIGISMGGMIAQEMAYQIPTRICTLSLISTASHLFRTTGFLSNLAARASLFLPKSPSAKLTSIKHNLYTPAWLSAPDAIPPVSSTPFPTNGDRFAANELRKQQHPEYVAKIPFMLQAVAAGWHYKSPEQLLRMAGEVGKRRIMVVHGTQDRMLAFPLGVVLWRGLEKGEGRTGRENWLGVEQEEDVWAEGGEIERHFVKGGAHVLPAEMRAEFNGWVANLVERGVRLNAEEGVEV